MSGSFGCFWGVKVPESDTDEQLEDLPYAEMLYRFTKSGYGLFSISSPDETKVSSFVEPNAALDAIVIEKELPPEGLTVAGSRAVSPPVIRGTGAVKLHDVELDQDDFDYRSPGKIPIRYLDDLAPQGENDERTNEGEGLEGRAPARGSKTTDE